MKEDQWFTTQKILVFLLLALSYALIREFSVELFTTSFLLFKMIFWLGILSLVSSGILSGFEVRSRKKFLIFLLWLFVVIALPYNEIVRLENPIPASIMIFVAYIPLTFLLQAPSGWILKLSSILLLMAAVFSNNHRPMSETFAQLTYLWLATSFIITLVDFFTPPKYVPNP